MNILFHGLPNKTFAPVSAKIANTTKINECFKPGFIPPSDNFPITNPVKNPCTIKNQKKGFDSSFAVAKLPVFKPLVTPVTDCIPVAENAVTLNPDASGSILYSNTRMMTIKIKNIIYP